MKLLQDILFGVEILEVAGSTHAAIPNVYFDSRKVGKMLYLSLLEVQ